MALQHRNLKSVGLVPSDDYLILSPTFLSNVTEAGIQTGVEEQKLPFGELIARGANCSKFDIGAYLLLSPMGGYTYHLLDKMYIICRESDIVAEAQITGDDDDLKEAPKQESLLDEQS